MSRRADRVRRLEGNGVELVRERAVAGRVQEGLERLYLLDRVADVGDYLKEAAAGEREALLVREADDGTIEMTLRLPALEDEASLDALCQIIEGVSHFVYVVERARMEREATQLEMELQAEVDKWVVLAASLRGGLDVDRSADLRKRLYERVSFEHDEASELGQRYRIANDAAHRFVRRMEREYVGRARFGEMRAELRRFFSVGQEEKLRLGRVA
ncbi:MAG TPA: hypothetical protein VHS09_14805 [Polyangiaceae bacterium]|nr:hypothetical protein [Polyangiaceae bacterium]